MDFLLADAAVVQVPQFGPLVFRIPLAEPVPERKEPFLGPRFLLLAPGAAQRGVEAPFPEPVEQGLGLQQAAAPLRAQVVGIGAFGDGFLVAVDDQVRLVFLGHALSKVVHLLELVPGIDVHEREGQFLRIEGLAREVQHDRGILADGIQHYGPFEFRDDLAHDVDALGFELHQV